jgi:hypothetical protein
MNASESVQHNRVLTTLLVAGLATFGGACFAQGTTTAPAAPAATVDAKPMPPSKSEMADSAFKKLDTAGEGYVTRDDTKGLPGFDLVFDKFDAKHDGKLTADQFAKAWTAYVSTKVSQQ